MLYLDRTTTESHVIINRISRKDDLVLDKLEEQDQGYAFSDQKFIHSSFPGCTIKISSEINNQWVINVWAEEMEEEDIEIMYRFMLKDIYPSLYSVVWSPECHSLYPTPFRSSVFTLLLINQRMDYIFPLEILFMIIEYMVVIPYVITKVSSRYRYDGTIPRNKKKELSQYGISSTNNYIMVSSTNFYQDLVKQNTIEKIMGTKVTYEIQPPIGIFGDFGNFGNFDWVDLV